MSIGLVANIYNEVLALPGWLETHLPFFDDVRILHAGPNGEYSNDGTIELLEKWRVPIKYTSINEGFGAVRTQAIRFSPCDWVMILDADERFYPLCSYMTCHGEHTPQAEADAILRTYDFSNKNANPDWNLLSQLGSKLQVDIGFPYNQGARLREILDTNRPDAVCSIRRHWHDFSFRKPTQNWMCDPDWQLRIVKNDPRIEYDPTTRMHERLNGVGSIVRADFERGPFFDHFHFTFKRMELGQRAHDVAIYDAIHEGRQPPTLGEFLSCREKLSS